jgi:carboxypeptidase PM20D1
MVKWIIGGVLALCVGVAAVLGVRMLTFGGSPAAQVASVTLAAAPAFDTARAAASLSRAIQIPTVSLTPGVVSDPDAFAALHLHLAQTYPRVHAAMTREIIAGQSLLFTLQGSDPQLAPMVFLAHQDVVPVEEGTQDQWPHPPFSGAIADDAVWGRGAMDDKGSLIALMEAMEGLLAQGFAPRRTVIFAFGHDEEVMGSGAVAMAAVLAQRGVRAWFVLDEGSATVADFPLTGQPAALIGLAEKGYMTVRVTAVGQGGHSSMPPQSTAAERLAQAILAIRGRPFPSAVQQAPVGDMLTAMYPHLGFAPRLAIANQWAFGSVLDGQISATPAGNALARTTIAPTVIGGGTKENVLAQEMFALVNLRLHPRDTPEAALAHLQQSVAGIEGVTLTVEGTPNAASPVSSSTSDSYALLAAAAGAASPAGAPVAPMLVLGATDARHYADVAENVYRYFPMMEQQADLARIHGTGERLSIANLGRMIGFYAQVIATGGAG